MNSNVKKICVSRNSTIREVMEALTGPALQGLPAGIAIVVDSEMKLEGIVTDGDIRRALVKGTGMDVEISTIMISDPITVPKGASNQRMMEIMLDKVRKTNRLRDRKVDHIIVVDDNKIIDDVISFYDLFRNLDFKHRTICIVGLGFVGLTLAVSLVDVGYEVVGFDLNEKLVNDIKAGKPHFYEKGLESLLRYHLNKGTLRIVNDLTNEITDTYIIAVGTPVDENKQPDMAHIDNAVRIVGKKLKPRDCVFLRSTVPVGTTRNFVTPILEETSGLKSSDDFMVAFTPERTVEGKALHELKTLPQIVGGINASSTDAAANFFANLTDTIVRVPSTEEAEMVKLINNSFRDLSFAFSNELSVICDKLNIDAHRLISAANQGYSRNPIPLPSPGVGGICLKKDPYIYASAAKQAGLKSCLPLAGRIINESIPGYIAGKMAAFLGKEKDKKVFIVGFAFKGSPETSDVRGSVTLDLISEIKDYGWQLTGYDPLVPAHEIASHGVTPLSLEQGFESADCIIFMNNHPSYEEIDLMTLLQKVNKRALFIDGWRIFPADDIERFDGLVYDAIGFDRDRLDTSGKTA